MARTSSVIMPEIAMEQQDVPDNAQEEKQEPAPPKSVVGIIYPPPEVRSILKIE